MPKLLISAGAVLGTPERLKSMGRAWVDCTWLGMTLVEFIASTSFAGVILFGGMDDGASTPFQATARRGETTAACMSVARLWR